MFKKIGMGVAAAAIGFAVLHMSGMTSYTATAWSNVRKNFKRNVPVEFEIERLRHEVAQLVPDMKKHFSAMAEEMVSVENLQRDVTDTRAKLQKQKESLMRMTHDIESGKSQIVYNGRTYSSERIKLKLEQDFTSFRTCEAELKTKEQLLEAKERSLESAREQLSVMKVQKQDLEMQLGQLEAELKAVRLAQTRSKVQLDDSQLARCKATLAEIRNRLHAEQYETTLQGEYANDPAVAVEKKEVPTQELIKTVRDHLNAKDNTVADKE